MTKRGVVAIAVLMVATLGLLPTPAEATCGQSGTIVSVWAYPGLSLTSIYLRNVNASASGILWIATTTDAKIVSAAVAALPGQTRVQLYGGAASCPTTGNYRSMGTVLLLVLAP